MRIQEHKEELLIVPQGIPGALGIPKHFVEGWDDIKAELPDQLIHIDIPEKALKNAFTVAVNIGLGDLARVDVVPGAGAGDISPDLITILTKSISPILEDPHDIPTRLYVPSLYQAPGLKGLGLTMTEWGDTPSSAAVQSDMRRWMWLMRSAMQRRPRLKRVKAERPTRDTEHFKFYARHNYLPRYNRLVNRWADPVGLGDLGIPWMSILWIVIGILSFILSQYSMSKGIGGLLGDKGSAFDQMNTNDQNRPESATGPAFEEFGGAGKKENDIEPDEKPAWQQAAIYGGLGVGAIIIGGVMIQAARKEKKE